MIDSPDYVCPYCGAEYWTISVSSYSLDCDPELDRFLRSCNCLLKKDLPISLDNFDLSDSAIWKRYL